MRVVNTVFIARDAMLRRLDTLVSCGDGAATHYELDLIVIIIVVGTQPSGLRIHRRVGIPTGPQRSDSLCGRINKSFVPVREQRTLIGTKPRPSRFGRGVGASSVSCFPLGDQRRDVFRQQACFEAAKGRG